MQRSLIEEWDDPKLEVSPRSRLYNMQPLGQGTALQEAQLSYLVRLANAHCVAPISLIRYEILPHTDIHFDTYCGSFVTHNAKTINGYTPYGKQFIHALGQLTGRDDLHANTFHAWGDVLDPRAVGLLHKYPRWCPDCLYEWRENGKEAYFPLYWYAYPATHCPEHQRYLVEVCHHCGKRQPFIPKHYHIDHCSYCGHWLGHDDPRRPDPTLTPYEQYSANAVQEMIQEGRKAKDYASQSRLQEHLYGYAKLTAGGVYSVFERQLGIKEKVLSQWFYRDSHPQIGQLFQACYRLDTTLVRLLRDEVPDVAPMIAKITPRWPAKAYANSGVCNEDDLRLLLLLSICRPEEHPTLKHLADELRCSVSYLKYWCPHECAEITIKRKRYLEEKRLEQTLHAEETTYNIVMGILQQGQRFNRKVVDKLLRPHKLTLARPAARHGMNRAKAEFFADYPTQGAQSSD